ncbi:hypothetical protein [Mycobacterium leprae]|uniref:hypothetical protein n=1 Tax=Mycobacterium leprae TaxID=1769 RepID=UPI0002EB074E
MRALLLIEELRLLVAAMGYRRLLVTVIDSGTDGPGLEAALPSAFFLEIVKWAAGDSDHEVA